MSEIENLKIDGGATYTVGNQDIIANEWEASKTYVKGKSYVINEHKLYVCNTTHTSTNPFDPTNWTEITVGDALGNLNGTTLPLTSNPADGTVSDAIGDKADKVANGTYNFSGIWSPSFYSSRSMFIPFPNANDYTVTLVRARYASDNTTMNDITSTAQIPTGGVSEVGIQVSTTSNCDLKYGDIQLKFE